MPRKGRRVETSRFAPAYQTFLVLLKQEREKRGLSQRQLSDLLDRHHNFVSSCEMGDRMINFVEVRAWCLALDLDWIEFTRKVDEELAKQDFGTAPTAQSSAPSDNTSD